MEKYTFNDEKKIIKDYSIFNLAINKRVYIYLKKQQDNNSPNLGGILKKIQGDFILIEDGYEQIIIPIDNISTLHFSK